MPLLDCVPSANKTTELLTELKN
uniref:Uncharacterized protein n=1 Tax=Anguilla anguilla TaxID=7936 RepID=A0A0E9W4C2_ANGAN